MATEDGGLNERPVDPNSAFYLTNCFVCNEKAKNGKVHLRNYGAVVCLSCRAFWRRCHQMSQDPTFRCVKNTNDCVIDVQTRRSCQRCRFVRCEAAGMRPEAVLNEQQRAGRFGSGGGRRRKRPQGQQSGSGNQEMNDPPTPPQPPDEQLSKILTPKVSRISEVFGAASRLNDEDSAEKLWQKLDEVFARRNENLVAGRKEFWSNVARLSSEFRQFATMHR